MKTAYLKVLNILLISLIMSTGCFLSMQEKLEKLPDKKFYFTEFQFILPGQDSESAYRFFKNFPVKKILYMLAREYNITIDMSEYDSFIKNKKISAIKADGLWRISRHTWAKKNIENNRIVIIFEQDYIYENKLQFNIGIYNGNTLLKEIGFDIGKIDSIFRELGYYFKTAGESSREFEVKNYAKVTPVPLIIEAGNVPGTSEENTGTEKIKSVIDDYVKTLTPEEKNKFKHDIIDYIYQKCN